jgi:hypothetical protein
MSWINCKTTRRAYFRFTILLFLTAAGCTSFSLRDWHYGPDNFTGAERELVTAIMLSDVKRVQLLISEGVDVNAQGTGGERPILYAVYKNDLQLFELLLKNGARADYVPDVPPSPYALIIWYEMAEFLEMALRYGASPDIKISQRSRLLINEAILTGETWAVDILLLHGVEINNVEFWGHDPFFQALSGSQFDIAETLLFAGSQALTKPRILEAVKSMYRNIYLKGFDTSTPEFQKEILRIAKTIESFGYEL